MLRKFEYQELGRRSYRRTLLFCFLLCISVISPISYATSIKVAIIASKESITQQFIVEELQRSLNKMFSGKEVNLEFSLYEPNNLPTNIPLHSLWITVGFSAATSYYELEIDSPVLHGLLPRSILLTIIEGNRKRNIQVHGIHLDQPPIRLLNLVSAASPKFTHIGVLLGPSSSSFQFALNEYARKAGITLHTENISTQSDLIAALERVLVNSHVLLALPDPLIYNRYSIQKILLATYRRKVPVVSFSSALVRAGASMAVHTTQEQIAHQLAEEAFSIIDNPRRPGTFISPPKYFSVSINQQVLRSLELSIPDDESLLRKLLELEK